MSERISQRGLCRLQSLDNLLLGMGDEDRKNEGLDLGLFLIVVWVTVHN